MTRLSPSQAAPTGFDGDGGPPYVSNISGFTWDSWCQRIRSLYPDTCLRSRLERSASGEHWHL